VAQTYSEKRLEARLGRLEARLERLVEPGAYRIQSDYLPRVDESLPHPVQIDSFSRQSLTHLARIVAATASSAGRHCPHLLLLRI
jgi:hypothetical protein